jgi:hypothetical protein
LFSTDYLSGPEEQNKKVLGHFTQEIDLSGQSFTEGLIPIATINTVYLSSLYT